MLRGGEPFAPRFSAVELPDHSPAQSRKILLLPIFNAQAGLRAELCLPRCSETLIQSGHASRQLRRSPGGFIGRIGKVRNLLVPWPGRANEYCRSHRPRRGLSVICSGRRLPRLPSGYAAGDGRRGARERRVSAISPWQFPRTVWTAAPDGAIDSLKRRWFELNGFTQQQSLGRRAPEYMTARSAALPIHQGSLDRPVQTPLCDPDAGAQNFAARCAPSKSLGSLMLDLDHFKKCNDTCGHGSGDTVRHETALCSLSKSIRVEDIVCRFGGERFVIVPGHLEP